MMSKKLPSFSQWKQIFKILKKTEKRVLIAFIILAIASFAWLAVSFYINATKSVPTYGGTYTEGIVGQPRFINPIYGETNDVDRTLIGLIYSGIMTYDKDGNIAPDLVEDYHISEDGRTYTFQLKDNLFWQDGVPLAIDDIIFTIKTIQNSDYKSPLRANWLDVGIEKVFWVNDQGIGGNAVGTTSWSISAIPLVEGDNVIIVIAKDSANNIATDKITVTRDSGV